MHLLPEENACGVRFITISLYSLWIFWFCIDLEVSLSYSHSFLDMSWSWTLVWLKSFLFTYIKLEKKKHMTEDAVKYKMIFSVYNDWHTIPLMTLKSWLELDYSSTFPGERFKQKKFTLSKASQDKWLMLFLFLACVRQNEICFLMAQSKRNHLSIYFASMIDPSMTRKSAGTFVSESVHTIVKWVNMDYLDHTRCHLWSRD